MEALATADGPNAEQGRRAQVEYARNNSWGARAKQLVEILERPDGKPNKEVDSERRLR